MRTQKKRLDTERLSAYLKAHHRAFAWAEKALRYRSAGKMPQVKAAVARVNHWMSKIAVMEAARAQ
jgi:Tfp pilus assembly protein PilX